MRAVFGLAGASIEFTRKGGTGPYAHLLGVDTLRMAARAGQASGLGVGESPSLAVTLENNERQAAAVLGNPLRVPVAVTSDSGAPFYAGTVSAVKFGRTITCTLEYPFLWEDLPLRTTRMLGDFADDQVLPHRLGDLRGTRFKLIRLSATEWFAADHAMQITEVQIDDEPTASWTQEIRTDDAGNTWTVVVLGAPADPEARVTASGVGRLDDRTGRLITNPADVFEYVFRLAGSSAIFPFLRAEAAAEGIELACSIDEIKSCNAWLDNIAYSFGGIWTPEMARLYPMPVVAGPVTDLDRLNSGKVEVASDLQDTCDVLRVSYNFDEASGRAQSYVELSAKPYSYRGVVKEVSLPWLRTATNAEAVGRRMLQRMAGRTYAITLTATGERAVDLRPCQWVRLNDHPGWPIDDSSPVAMALAVNIQPDSRQTEATFEVTTLYPRIEVTSHSVAVPIGVGAGVDVAIANGVATFTVQDENGQPLRDAMVSLDNGAAKKTNAQGKVSFTVKPSTPPRKHQLAVAAAGFTDFILEVYL